MQNNNMNNNSQNKLVSNDSLSKTSFLLDKVINPKRDWAILIILFFVFIITSVSFDYYMYRKIISGDMYVSVKREDLVIENLKSSNLKKVLDNFELKTSKISGLKIEKLTDPSI